MIKIYSTNWWGSCIAAKKMLDDKGLSYEEINIEEQRITREDLVNITGGFSVPQIVINDTCIGGFEKLLQLNQSGELKELVANSWTKVRANAGLLPGSFSGWFCITNWIRTIYLGKWGCSPNVIGEIGWEISPISDKNDSGKKYCGSGYVHRI